MPAVLRGILPEVPQDKRPQAAGLRAVIHHSVQAVHVLIAHCRLLRRRHVLVSRLAAFRGHELLAAGRLEDRTAQLDDVAHTLGLEFHDLVEHQSLVPTHDSLHGEPVVDCAAGHRANCRIHARRVAARGQNADAFDSGHTLIIKNKTAQR